jgi:Tat protein secretion system quality control protein TatD with DNase activity
MDAWKPMIVHTRRRERRALEILTELGARRVCWHCFGGKAKLARAVAEAGHWLSIPANARRSESFTRMLETLPRERLLLETDCPYLGPDRAAERARDGGGDGGVRGGAVERRAGRGGSAARGELRGALRLRAVIGVSGTSPWRRPSRTARPPL